MKKSKDRMFYLLVLLGLIGMLVCYANEQTKSYFRLVRSVDLSANQDK